MTETGMIDETPKQTAIRQYMDKYGSLGIDAEFFIEAYEAAKLASLPQDRLDIISNVLHRKLPLGTMSTGEINVMAACVVAALPPVQQGVLAHAVEIDFERELPRVTFEVPADSAWGLGMYRIVKGVA